MSVPAAPALAPTSTVGVPTTFPFESNVGSRVLMFVVPVGIGSSSTVNCPQLKSAVKLIADFSLELRRCQRRGLIGENDSGRRFRPGFKVRLGQEDRPRLQSGEHDADENGGDQSELDRWRAGFVPGELSRRAAHASEECAH